MRISSILTAAFIAAGTLSTACQRTETATQPAAVETQVAKPAAVSGDRTLTVYSGRNEKLIGPLFARFTENTGIRIEARYGESAEMAATLLEEAGRTPADVFVSQDAAALGAVASAGLAKALPFDAVSLVPARFADPQRRWVGLSGRARSLVFNRGKYKSSDLPQSLEALGDPKFRKRFGIAPSNASLQAQMAVYHALKGEDALKKLLAAIVANEPRRYPKNDAIVNAVVAGEIDFGLVNHYYLLQAKKQKPEITAENFFMPSGEAASFVNVAGVAVLSDQPEATELVRFLLSADSQKYFAEQTFEYPLIAEVTAAKELPPIAELRTPDLDFAKVSAVLPKTLELINQSGLSKQ